MINHSYYSFVVPVYNEEGNVAQLYQEILHTAKLLQKPFEIIFVDDGSSDNTQTELKKLKPIIIIQLRKNSGQSAALDAGFKASQGNVIVSLDGDGQNDPADIPHLVDKLEQEELDVVCGWRFKRKDNIFRRFISLGARFWRSILVSDGIHDAGCTLRVYRKEAIADLDLYGELHRMIPAILRWQGFKIGEMKVNHRPRTRGVSKYNYKRTVKGFLDMLDVWFWRKFEGRPLHLFGGLGLLLLGVSTMFGFYLGFMRLFFAYSLSNKIWPLIVVTGFITGIQLLIFGLLANLIIKGREDHKFYKVKKIITG